eukprot:2802792-Pleurochrysis_carterae.AAC.1
MTTSNMSVAQCVLNVEVEADRGSEPARGGDPSDIVRRTRSGGGSHPLTRFSIETETDHRHQ